MHFNTLFASVAHVATERPDSLALQGPEGEKLSYGELHAYSQALATFLIDKGIDVGDRVAVLGGKSVELIASLYGILQCGAAYVPLSGDWPSARIRHILQSVGAKAIIIDSQYRYILEEIEPPPLAIWTSNVKHSDISLPRLFASAARRVNGQEMLPAVSTEELAYIIFTSGSTGDPKGVMHTHGSALAFVRWAATELALQSSDRISSHAPFNFDLSIFDLFATAYVGATMVVPSADVQSVPKRFVQWLEEQEITTVYSVPGVWVASQHQSAPVQLRHPHLRRIIYAGEPMAPKHVLELQQALPQAKIYNYYGPTETNVCAAFAVPTLDPDNLPGAIPIGTAASFDSITIEDGELLVSGPSVMAGYWGKTARSENEQYHTGDIVSWNDAMGGYVFLGRRDTMRKIRGFRVELGEVEACLLRYHGTAEAVVVVDESDSQHHTLLAFVVPANGASQSAVALKRHCADFLPPYMVPRIVWRSELPRTATGKIDRGALNAEINSPSGKTDTK